MAWERFTKKQLANPINSSDYESFVTLYMEAYKLGRTNKETAESMKLGVGQFHSRVSNLRRKGVDLPKLAKPKRTSSLNVKNLNKIVKA